MSTTWSGYRPSKAARIASTLGPLLLASTLTACGGPRDGAELRTETSAGESGAPSQRTPTSAPATRSVETLDLCALVPVAEVAAILGHDPSSGSAKPTMGRWASDCTYSFRPGGGVFDVAMIWAYPPELWAPELKDGAREVPGLGDSAYSTTMSGFSQMSVLVAGDLYLDTRAETPKQALGLAQLAVERLTKKGAAQ